MTISDWVPPVARKALRKIKPAFKIYTSFQAAEKMAAIEGHYNHDIVTDIVLEKTKQYAAALKETRSLKILPYESFLLSSIGVLATHQAKLSVLDLGGAFGAHYFLAKRAFPHIDFDWTLLELPKVVEKGKVLENDELTFRDTQGDLSQKIGDFDLVLTSATLQHMPDPTEALAFLIKQQAKALLFLRLGLNAGNQHLWVIHRARYQDCGPPFQATGFPDGQIELPFCLLSSESFNAALATDYQLHLEMVEHSGVKWVQPGVSGFNRLYNRK